MPRSTTRADDGRCVALWNQGLPFALAIDSIHPVDGHDRLDRGHWALTNSLHDQCASNGLPEGGR